MKRREHAKHSECQSQTLRTEQADGFGRDGCEQSEERSGMNVTVGMIGGGFAEGGNSRRRGQGGPRAWQRGLFFAVFGHPSSVFGCFLLFVFLFRLHLRLRLRLGLGLDLGLGLGLGFRLRLRLRLHLCLGLGLGLGLRLRLCFLFGFFIFSILCFSGLLYESPRRKPG